MPNPNSKGDSPHFITEPLLCSFKPQKLDDGSIRMAFIKGGQKAYNMWGEEATLTSEFIQRDYPTWEGGVVSINHQYNGEWVKATMKNIVYDPEEDIGICSFFGVSDWLESLIYSEDYRGLSQECVPIEYNKNSYEVIKGYGTGCTIVTDPYEPAANQTMGIGIPPALAAILASKYPTNQEVNMPENKGGGTPATVSAEMYESAVSRNAQFESKISTFELESKKKDDEISSLKKIISEKDGEIASTKEEYDKYKSGETNRTNLAYSKGKEDGRTELLTETERLSAIEDFTKTHGEDFAKSFLATNPSMEQIKVLTAGKKVESASNVGGSTNAGTLNEEKPKTCVSRRWDSVNKKYVTEWA